MPDEYAHEGIVESIDGRKIQVEEGGGGSPSFYCVASVFANSPSTLGGYSARSLDATEVFQPLTAVNVLQTLTAGAGNGFGWSVIAPKFGGGTCVIDAIQLVVVNGAGTEKLAVQMLTPFPVASGEQINPDMRAWDVAEQIGSDLAVSADGATVDSTAGGQFTAQIYVAFTTDGLAP